MLQQVIVVINVLSFVFRNIMPNKDQVTPCYRQAEHFVTMSWNKIIIIFSCGAKPCEREKRIVIIKNNRPRWERY